MEEQHLVDLVLPSMRLPRRPVFLEVGGYDGIHESNTLYLQHCLGWSGIMIEAQPVNFNQLVVNRPGVITLNSALSNECLPYSNISFSRNPSTGSRMERSSLLRVNRPIQHVKVPCAPLQHYLDLLQVKDLSFLSIDVESFELHVIRSLDWARTSVGAMVCKQTQACG